MEKQIQPDTPSPNNFFFHPYNILLHLVLFSLAALFLAFSVAYVYSRIQGNIPPVKLPTLFYINTVLLLASSATINRAKRCYEHDNTEAYQKALLWTILLSIVFLISQVFAWQSLFQQNIFLTHSNTASYVYLISGLHFLHILVGLPFLILFLRTAQLNMKEPASVLVYFSDPEKQLKLRLLAIYWHFLDGLWIYLVLFFGINYLLQ